MVPPPPAGPNPLKILLAVAVVIVIGAVALLPFMTREEGLDAFVAFKAGTSWRYRSVAAGVTLLSEARGIAAGKGGVDIVEAVTKEDGTPAGELKYSWRIEDGFLVKDEGSRKLRFLRLGSRKGHSWLIDPSKPDGLVMKHMGWGPATAGGRRYPEAINVRLQQKATWVDYYLVPGVGLVLEIEATYPDPAAPSAPTLTRELLSFSPGK